MVRNFLWKGGQSKISLHTLQKARESGGFRLVNLEAKQQALKMQWVYRIRNNEFFSEVAISQLIPDLGLFGNVI